PHPLHPANRVAERACPELSQLFLGGSGPRHDQMACVMVAQPGQLGRATKRPGGVWGQGRATPSELCSSAGAASSSHRYGASPLWTLSAPSAALGWCCPAVRPLHDGNTPAATGVESPCLPGSYVAGRMVRLLSVPSLLSTNKPTLPFSRPVRRSTTRQGSFTPSTHTLTFRLFT